MASAKTQLGRVKQLSCKPQEAKKVLEDALKEVQLAPDHTSKYSNSYSVCKQLIYPSHDIVQCMSFVFDICAWLYNIIWEVHHIVSSLILIRYWFDPSVSW